MKGPQTPIKSPARPSSRSRGIGNPSPKMFGVLKGSARIEFKQSGRSRRRCQWGARHRREDGRHRKRGVRQLARYRTPWSDVPAFVPNDEGDQDRKPEEVRMTWP